MAQRPSLVPHRNSGYDPYATRYDTRVRCGVCGWAGIDPEKWQEPERQVFSVVTTGSTYAPDTGDTVEDLADIDEKNETQYGVHAGCPHCGSPRWADGSAPDLKW